MENKLGILILHGVGIQKIKYSARLQQEIKSLFKSRGYGKKSIEFQEVLYSNIFGDQQEQRASYLINTSHAFQIVTRFFRWLLIFILSDAVSYRGCYKRVHEQISKEEL